MVPAKLLQGTRALAGEIAGRLVIQALPASCHVASNLTHQWHTINEKCGSPPGVMMADTLSFNAKIGVVDF